MLIVILIVVVIVMLHFSELKQIFGWPQRFMSYFIKTTYKYNFFFITLNRFWGHFWLFGTILGFF